MNDSAAPSDSALADFIQRWQASGAAERANYVLFLTQLCDVLAVAEPNPTTDDPEKNTYVFERDVTFDQGDGTSTTGRIDLYKRGNFVLEAKQGSDAQREEEEATRALGDQTKKAAKKKGTAVRGTKAWDDAMIRARGQADRYARALPASEGWPPFLIVVDVGHSIELYSEFTRQGKTYIPFPDPQSFRIKLADLADEKVRERLKLVWTDPLALDPSKKSAKVTRELASRLAELAKLLERANHDPARVARFLMRCLFTMFAEDVELIPKDAFKKLLTELEETPENFQPMVASLWQTMDSGGFSTILRKHVARFNGGLFAEHEALNLSRPMLKLLRQAAEACWGDVEPAIFGTLLERALDPVERHKLGAHYTPRAYVERLVMPTIIEPLRDEWNTIYATALNAARSGKLTEAHDLIRHFHEKLCETRVLDPACGSGNFLYVTLEHMKRLEGEVLNALRELGYEQKILLEIDPHQFLGIELNPRAAAIADLVLWIGYLQWHFRTRGKAQPAEPIIKNYQNIECRDAVLAWDRTEPLLDDAGQPVTRWDGRTTKTHPVTGEQVPDEAAQVPVLKYINPRKAAWPKADYVVGNPPFIGTAKMRDALGSGYTEALRATYEEIPESCDYVMYWWNNAAELVRESSLSKFGFIATNSLRQTFNRRVLAKHLSATPSLALTYAVPDHPWVDSADGAAVRISMTIGARGPQRGRIERVVDEVAGEEAAELTFASEQGIIQADLTCGAAVSATQELLSNKDLSNRGFCLFGSGFIVSKDEAKQLGRGSVTNTASYIRVYRNGRDLTGRNRDVMVIDLFGLKAEEVRAQFPQVYQWVIEKVKPERDVNPRKSRRDNWWIFGEPNAKLRQMIAGLRRYIATVETSKHRFFVFLEDFIAPDNSLVVIALDDAFHLGILSSRAHVVYALSAGGRLGVGNDPRYNKSRCFEPFPFPGCSDERKSRIRLLAEQLDAHRKRQQEQHPWLTLTDTYNVLEKLRSGETLTDKDQKIHAAGLVSVLKQIHDDLDAAVFAAYGWPTTLSDEQILERLVALNAERAAEEARGLIRWLRPEFQCQSSPPTPSGTEAEETSISGESLPAKKGRSKASPSRREGTTQSRPLTPSGPEAEDAFTSDDGQPAKKGRSKASPSRREGTTLGAEETSTSGESLPARKGRSKVGPSRREGTTKQPWPKELAARTKAIQDALAGADVPITSADLAKRFLRARQDTVEDILTALVSLGLAHRQGSRKNAGGTYSA